MNVHCLHVAASRGPVVALARVFHASASSHLMSLMGRDATRRDAARWRSDDEKIAFRMNALDLDRQLRTPRPQIKQSDNQICVKGSSFLVRTYKSGPEGLLCEFSAVCRKWCGGERPYCGGGRRRRRSSSTSLPLRPLRMSPSASGSSW